MLKKPTCINILNSKCLNIITTTVFFFPGIKILKKARQEEREREWLLMQKVCLTQEP